MPQHPWQGSAWITLCHQHNVSWRKFSIRQNPHTINIRLHFTKHLFNFFPNNNWNHILLYKFVIVLLGLHNFICLVSNYQMKSQHSIKAEHDIHTRLLKVHFKLVCVFFFFSFLFASIFKFQHGLLTLPSLPTWGSPRLTGTPAPISTHLGSRVKCSGTYRRTA